MGWFALLSATLLACVAPVASRARAAAPPDSSILNLAGPREPGIRMVVTGHVVRAGNRPAAGVRLGVYHTDARGDYGERPGRAAIGPRAARLSGWLKTDARGRYEVRTIRPGAYPGESFAEHIHFILPQSMLELQFADDRRVGAASRRRSESLGTFGEVRPVRRDRQGTLHVVRDFRVSP